MLRKLIAKSAYSVALSTLTSPVMLTGANSSTDPGMSIFAREFSFEESPSAVPSSFWMPVAKLGMTDKSAKLAWLACKTIFLIDIGMAGPAAGTGAGCGGVGDLRPLRGKGGAGAGAAVAASGGLASPLGATTVAPGAAKMRFTLIDSSGSIMTRAYSFRTGI